MEADQESPVAKCIGFEIKVLLYSFTKGDFTNLIAVSAARLNSEHLMRIFKVIY